MCFLNIKHVNILLQPNTQIMIFKKHHMTPLNKNIGVHFTREYYFSLLLQTFMLMKCYLPFLVIISKIY